jgi:hypothetical protein
MTFHIIAYPDGARAVVGTMYARDIVDVLPSACTHARMRGEYVDVETDGRCAAVVDGRGPAHGYGEFRVR